MRRYWINLGEPANLVRPLPTQLAGYRQKTQQFQGFEAAPRLQR
jgi:hypothetical protein